jgi:hypothetical protein
MSDAYADMWARFTENLDRQVEQMLAELPSPPPPKPFDLADLTRLASTVEASRQTRVDRAIIAPDVRDWLLANVATKPAERPSPDHLWDIPVVIDEDIAPGSWELRCGDRVVRRSGESS